MITVFVSQTSGNLGMKNNQEAIRRTLEAKKINYKEVDVADPNYQAEKERMQEALKLNDDDLVALPPQIFKGEQHCGDFQTFFAAVEEEKVFAYLDMDPPPGEVEYERKHEPQCPDAGFIDQGEIVQLKYV